MNETLKLITVIILVSLGEGSVFAQHEIGFQTRSKVEYAESGVPDIECDVKRKDLGTVEEGTTVHYSFTIKNAGTANLILKRVTGKSPHYCCGSHYERFERNELGPGETTKLLGQFDTTERLGPFYRNLIIESNDPDETTTTVKVEFYVTSEIRLTPRRVHFGQIESEHGATRIVKIESKSSTPLEIKKLRVINTDIVNANVLERSVVPPPPETTETSPPITHISIQLDVLRNATTGQFSGQVELVTNSLRRPTIIIPIAGKVVGDLTAMPSGLLFGVIAPGERRTRTLTIKSQSKKKFSIIDIESDCPNVSWEAPGNRKKREHEITITFAAPAEETEKYLFKIRINTDHPKEKSIEIPMRAIVRKKVTSPSFKDD